MAHQKSLQKKLLTKQKLLKAAKLQLKTEFVGIDSVIDEVIESVSSWFLFPNFQEKPVIVNLWGLTGVGKTALVNRIAELLYFSEKYYRFDLGDDDLHDWSIKAKLNEIYENSSGFPIIIALDEFQFARTINGNGEEINKSASRIIWQLLDSGKYQISRYSTEIEEIHDLSLKLKHLLKRGITVKEGKVRTRKEFFIKALDVEFEYEIFDSDDKQYNLSSVSFVPEHFHEKIFEAAKGKFSSFFEVKSQLAKLNGYQTIDYLQEIINYALSPKIVDCTKSLIFVIGNLDEAYTMSADYNPDTNADEFHEQSLKITVPKIKSALRQRFRNEQIARLGNMHIIYPALNQDSFQKIIALELNNISEMLYQEFGAYLTFDNSVHELIFREGVYPAQGARPIFSTIYQLIKTKLGKVIIELTIKNIAIDEINFCVNSNILIINFIKANKIIHSLNEKLQLNLEKIRKCKKDDLQAIAAVHEAGHAIIACILLRTIPDTVFSQTTSGEGNGFVYTKFKWNYISKKEITNRLALFLAGFAAEKLIFGDENITTGSDDDINTATGFITSMLKQCGMGKLAAAYNSEELMSRYFVYDCESKLNDEAKEYLKASYELAERVLTQQYSLLIKMADFLSDNRVITKITIRAMLIKYAKDFDVNSIIENGERLLYRKLLKTAATNLEKKLNENPCPISYQLSLNKNSNSNIK